MILKSILFSKRILFDEARVLKLQRPVGMFMFMRTDVIKKLIFTDLFFELIKSTSYFIMYFWEASLMIGGLFVGLLALFLWFSPTGLNFLLSAFPMMGANLEILGIEPQPMSFYEGCKDFIYHPLSGIYYYSTLYFNRFY